MNAITSVSKQTNTMVTKMLTWLKNEFQTSGWHHCGCLSVIHNLWLYTQGCWHRNHLTEKYFLLKWLSYSVDGNHRFTELDHTAAHFPLFSEFCCFTNIPLYPQLCKSVAHFAFTYSLFIQNFSKNSLALMGSTQRIHFQKEFFFHSKWLKRIFLLFNQYITP